MDQWVRCAAAVVGLSLTLGVCNASAQSVGERVQTECLDLNQAAVTQARNGQIEEAKKALSAALAEQRDPFCSGLILSNMAALAMFSRQFGEAEAFSERALNLLEGKRTPDSLIFLRPLQILALSRLERGKISKARDAFQRILEVRIELPFDSALVHQVAGALAQAEGRLAEAEAQYLAAVRDWEKVEPSEAGELAGILNSLATVYWTQNRLHDVIRVVNQALEVVARAKYAVPIDRIVLHHLRGRVLFQQRRWKEAELDLFQAVSIADREPQVTPDYRATLLTDYAGALRKNRRGREASSIEARVLALRRDGAGATVDITDLISIPDAKKR